MIGIIDYGSGNVGNIRRALDFLKRESAVLECPPSERSSMPDALILPGVGAFGPAMSKIESSGWREALDLWIHEGRPIIGICLGMQLLCEASEEDSTIKGLGIFEGNALKLEGTKKLPHIGWNTVTWPGSSKSAYYYFVHSFALPICRDTLAVTSVDSCVFTSIALKDRVLGFQFHPERSGSTGLDLLGESMRKLGV
ncbi:MAG: imidazole glycerol phosphate synthase subunit HisH [Thermovirgaceae bacterium]|nr:imidazole glycerol phosphate synthase subunit HisH [Thermovirgaceae bacterium]